jgi:hypothetical protein
VVLAVSLAVCGCGVLPTSLLPWDRRTELAGPIVVGRPAPEIEGVDLDGVPFQLSDYRGRVVLLDFWANW